MKLIATRLCYERSLPVVILGLMLSVCLFSASQGQQIGDDSKTATGTIIGTVSSKWVKCDSVVIVYIDTVKGDYHPDTTIPIMDQINRVFRPHILPILVGTTVRFTNSDSLDHNVFSPSKLKPFNIGTWGYGKIKDYTFEKTGVVLLLCNIHSEMAAVIMILQNPFFAVVGTKGGFTISGVPPGTYTLKAYHERMNETSKQVIVTAGDTTVVDFDLAL